MIVFRDDGVGCEVPGGLGGGMGSIYDVHCLFLGLSSSRAVHTSPITLSLFRALLFMLEFRTVDPMLLKELMSADTDTGVLHPARGSRLMGA